MGTVKTTQFRTTVPPTVISASGNTGVLIPPWGASSMVVQPTVSAYTSGTITYEVQWSFDGTNFYSADPKDTFANLTATGAPLKYVTVKAPYYRITWTTGAYTHALTDAPVGYTVNSPTSWEQGASAFSSPVVGAIASALVTNAANSAIVAVPANASRIALLYHTTAIAGTANVLYEVRWSYNGTTFVPADPTDVLGTAIAATGNGPIKELPVKAPFYTVIVGGTCTSATFSVDTVATSA